MPIYTFRNKNTDEEFDEMLKISELDVFMNAHPHYERVFTPIMQIDSGKLMGRTKTTLAFQNRLREIKKAHRHSTIRTGNTSEI